MRICIHSNSRGWHVGGSAAYVLALAGALGTVHDIDLLAPVDLSEDAARTLLPDLGAFPATRKVTRRTRLDDLRLAVRDRQYDLVIVRSPFAPPLTFARRAMVLCEFPFQTSLGLVDRLRLASYDMVVANSEFTASWIARRWRRTAAVLYPAVAEIAPSEKRPMILAVGRFVGPGRSKRQLEMVRLFREISPRAPGWELHLAGFTQDPSYVTAVRREAEGLPVVVHENVTRARIVELYGHASVFWHASGAGSDPEEVPEVQEHFGIATAEAMSSGCVAVVVRSGGQPEVVGDAGLLWDTWEECGAQTLRLVHDPALRSRLSERCRTRSRRFSNAVFRQRVLELVDQVVAA